MCIYERSMTRYVLGRRRIIIEVFRCISYSIFLRRYGFWNWVWNFLDQLFDSAPFREYASYKNILNTFVCRLVEDPIHVDDLATFATPDVRGVACLPESFSFFLWSSENRYIEQNRRLGHHRVSTFSFEIMSREKYKDVALNASEITLGFEFVRDK